MFGASCAFLGMGGDGVVTHRADETGRRNAAIGVDMDRTGITGTVAEAPNVRPLAAAGERGPRQRGR